MAFFPGGFGTGDEVFETLTLIQTGKAEIVPVVLVDHAGGSYWRRWVEFVQEQMAAPGMISPEDMGLFRVVDSVEEAAAEIEAFYRVFHSYRYLGENLVLRLRRRMPAAVCGDLAAPTS
jgi:predicted Rossmann-fold nucleotide-binding protein